MTISILPLFQNQPITRYGTLTIYNVFFWAKQNGWMGHKKRRHWGFCWCKLLLYSYRTKLETILQTIFMKYHSLFVLKIRMLQILSSAAVMIGAKRANALNEGPHNAGQNLWKQLQKVWQTIRQAWIRRFIHSTRRLCHICIVANWGHTQCHDFKDLSIVTYGTTDTRRCNKNGAFILCIKNDITNLKTITIKNVYIKMMKFKHRGAFFWIIVYIQ